MSEPPPPTTSMALVNQKYGLQGQADPILYALASGKSSPFHDVTVGSNNVPCTSYYGIFNWNCPTTGVKSLGEWSSTAGYDLATGLGSVDANALVTAWGTVPAAIPTSTTFTASQTTLTHGTPVVLRTLVSSSSTSSLNTPTGNVAVEATTTSPIGSVTDSYNVLSGGNVITLDGVGAGSFTAYLPGGSYSVLGRYSGDGTFAASKSAPVSVTVAPENTNLNLEFTATSTAPPINISGDPKGATIPYASTTTFKVIPLGVNATASSATGGIPTGSITVSDNGSVIATVPLAQGLATFSPALPVGSHSVTVSYSGDSSYNATSSGSSITSSAIVNGPVVFAIGKVTPSLEMIQPSLQGTFQAGADIELVVNLYPSGTGGAFPTGTVTVTFGTMTQTLPVALAGGNEGWVTAVFHSVPAGTYTPTATYSGDVNYTAVAATQAAYVSTFVFSAGPLASTSTTITLVSPTSLAAITLNGPVTVQATVTGSGTAAPTGTISFLADAFPVTANPVVLVPGSKNTSTALLTFTPSSLLNSPTTTANQLVAAYSGSTTYNTSVSDLLQLSAVISADFGLTTSTNSLAVTSGKTATTNLIIASLNSFSGTVAFACQVTGGPANNQILPTCSVQNGTAVTPNANGSATLQIGTTQTVTAFNKQPAPWKVPGGIVLAGLLLMVIPARRRKLTTLAGFLLICGMALSVSGCSHDQSVNGPTTKTEEAPTGTYTVLVTGTSGANTHNVAVTLIVQ
jgi:trimeric autotransporter adhesin